MSTSGPKMGIVHKWQIVKGYNRRFFENHYSYSVYLNCDERPHLQVGCPTLGLPIFPEDYKCEYDSYLLYVKPSPPLDTTSYPTLIPAVFRSPYHPQTAFQGPTTCADVGEPSSASLSSSTPNQVNNRGG